MTLAVTILAGVLVALCALVAYMTVQGIGLDNIKHRRALRTTADKLDKTEQQTADKKRATQDIINNRIPELAQKLTQEETRRDDLNRSVTQSQNTVKNSGHAWDAQITVLEEAGKLAGDRIVDPDAFTDSQRTFLEENGYRLLAPGETPPTSESAAARPVNPVRELEEHTKRSGAEQRQKATEMADSLHQEVRSAIPPPAARENLPQLVPRGQRVRAALKKATRRRGDQNDGATPQRNRGSSPQGQRKGKGS